MSKRLYFLISFVLVLSLSGFALAGTSIVVDNNSFEYDCNGNDVTCHVGHSGTPGSPESKGSMCDGSIAAWRYLRYGSDTYAWVGVDVNCGTEDVNCGTCYDWIEYPDGSANLYFQGTTSIHQIFDHNIAYGQKYTMTVDLFAWDDIVVEFFSPNDVCYPDANHLLLSSSTITPERWYNAETGREMYERDVKVEYVVADEALDGRKLGIKIGGDSLIGGTDDSYLWADHVRLEWSWASNAYDPDPPDGAGDVNSQALTLSWLPGLWAVGDVNGHEVYFGTSWAEVNDANTSSDPNIYRGTGVGVVSGPDPNGRYSYVILGGDLPLSLGESYFWRIDEVNDDYVGSVPKPWKGEVWSFEVEGKAHNVYPTDGAGNIPALNLILRWEAGAGAGGHDVYFGTSQADVEDANTSNTAMYPNVYRGTQALAEVNYPVEDLEVGSTYYWRIDEVNAGASTFVEGNVWSFTTGSFLIVDSFEAYRYQTDQELRDVWKDFYADQGGLNRAEVSIETTDESKFLGTGEQSMLYYYRNFTLQGKWYHSWAEANLPLEVGTDWTIGGVKALVVNYCGDPCNGREATKDYVITDDQMWLELVDGSANTGIVRLPNMSNVTDGAWHTWNISLQDPCFSGVDMNNVAKIYIGFGGAKGGKYKTPGAGSDDLIGDTVWFDDISLYPPRCMPEVTGIGYLRSLGDIGGGEGGAQDCNVNYLDLDIMAVDWLIADGCFPTEPQEAVLTMATGDPNWTGGPVGTGSLGFDPNIQVDVCEPGLTGLTRMSITCWVRRDGEMDGYEGIITSREGDVTTELTNGKGAVQVGYCWNNVNATWQWDSGVAIPDKTWTFVAMSVDPNGCTLYAHPLGGAQSSNRHIIELDPLGAFADVFWIGRGYAESRYWKGGMDDVQIWDYDLDANEMEYLATDGVDGNEPDPNCPVYHYAFDETAGLVAADTGCGAIVYRPPMSPANLVDPEPADSRFVNFRDYRIMAEHWLESHPWP